MNPRPDMSGMKTKDNRFIPGEFLFDVAGGAYLIVDPGHFVDSSGVLFRFADYGSFSKTSVYAESVVIETGKPRMLEFGVADDTAWKVGLSCGGTIRVYVEKVE